MFCLSLHSLWRGGGGIPQTPNLVQSPLSSVRSAESLVRTFSLSKVFITWLGIRQLLNLAGLWVPLRTHLNPFSLEPEF